MAWETLSIPDVSTDIESQYFETDDAIEWSYVDITSLNSLLVFNSEVTIYTKDNFRLAIYTTSTPGATYEPYRPEYRIYYNNTLVASALCYDCDTVGLAIGYNTETQKAKLRSVQKRWAVYPPSPSDALYSSHRVTWDSSTQSDVYNALLNANLISEPITANGGGATHIAKVTGQLKDLSSNLSDILMISGGGGGGLLLGDSGWHGTEQNIAWSGNNNKLTVQLDDDDVLFKMYIGSSNIYSFIAPVSDISNIYLQFLIDSENEVAKPSFVYKNGSSYSFNQEEPTDSEMADIYTWLSAGLPSE